jgi:hypothetical protein
VITSKLVSGAPHYSVQVRNWKTGNAVATSDFSFRNPTKAERVDLDKLRGADEMPTHFETGETE